MSYTLIVHITNAEPVVGEVERLPQPTDNLIVLHEPRQRDGKEVPYIDRESMIAIFPIHRISFIEVLTPHEEEEEIIGFVRE
ncbi:MAG: hypothetical protein RML93_01620 [Anaerolineales bacterium]|nr:hypothetical protein [Anaerolineales bacterium]MCS7246902.1 hypothetical protein [Anaerolineales bacterium]MDW8160713.1 hypothetical protein [Anaerolineales bacterium]MDW8445971.1 hypothetical protein [Anaerolineales bacterium]